MPGLTRLIDLLYQMKNVAENQVNSKKSYGMMISMGGNDKNGHLHHHSKNLKEVRCIQQFLHKHIKQGAS
ncbi:MAG: hypothetical protein ACXWM7_04370, partial [Parachlamydiaceae bacterium]